MARPYKFRKSMVSDALKAADALGSSPVASKLKPHGYTPASMTTDARELTELHIRVLAAKAALVQASAALSARGGEFAQKWASFSNLVRGLTSDEALRNALGVQSPGTRKGPLFRRGPRAKEPEPNAVASPVMNGASAANGHTVGHGQ
jgi:hypothetical protein